MLKCKSNQRRELRDNFQSYRKYFSKRVQKAKRQYWQQKQLEIENLDSNKPKLFWKEIGKLGIGKDRRQQIPMEVKIENWQTSNDADEVLIVWKNGFEGLLNPIRGNDYYDVHNDTITLLHREMALLIMK